MSAIPGGSRKMLLHFRHVGHPWPPKKNRQRVAALKNAALDEPHFFS
jgi:hypothetical protein